LITDRTLALAAGGPRSATVEDIEELPDWYFHRPVARRIVAVLLPTAVTPDQVTMWSGVAGVLASIALVLGTDHPVLRLVAAALLLKSVVLDCVDGQLARARKTMSPGGTALDTVVDVVVSLAMLLAATYVVWQQHETQWLWLLAPVAYVSYAVQCFCFDVAKERYLVAHGLAYPSSKTLLADQRVPEAGSRHGRTQAVLQRLFDRYWQIARRLTETPRRTAAGETGGPLYIRAWTFLGQGTHMAVLYTGAAVSYFWPPALYACLIVFAVVMNAMMCFLLVTDIWAARS
jgi:phosphatidylglycerophosphate synthase